MGGNCTTGSHPFRIDPHSDVLHSHDAKNREYMVEMLFSKDLFTLESLCTTSFLTKPPTH